MKAKEYIDNILNESIHDANLFKCIFFCGGPGSGKSYISNMMFIGLPVSFCNSDDIFERLLKKAQLPLKMEISNPNVYEKQIKNREIAKNLTNKRTSNWVNGMLPLVIDGTGRNYNTIHDKKILLEDLGYDTNIIFINTSLNVALKRNNIRDRSLPEKQVKEFWSSVQENIGKFQTLFGGDKFNIIDNNVEINNNEIEKFKLKLVRLAMKILNKPLENRNGIAAINKLNKIGGLYLSDILDKKEKSK